jgi:hypothetical protein
MDLRNETEEDKKNEGAAESAYTRMGRDWLGFGNLDAPCWFIGMEPGGTDGPTWPEIWATRFGGAPVIDLHAAAGDAEDKYLGAKNRLHPTWSPIVRMRLAYAGLRAEDSDVLRYQHEQLCLSDGGEALLEISAYAAANLGVPSLRKKYLESRIKHLRDLIRDRVPEIVVCYGTSYRAYYEQICGGPFDPDGSPGSRWSGLTRCTITTHPKPRFQAANPPQYWVDLGVALRKCVDERRGRSFPAATF